MRFRVFNRRPAGSNRQEGGFTLLELLIAMAILALGLTGIVNVQMRSSLGNMGARNMTAAVNLARSKIEELRRVKLYYIPTSGAAEVVAPDLQDDGDNTDLGNWTNPDHQDAGALDEKGLLGGRYIVAWNIADGVPGANMKTVRVRVSWTEGSTPRSVELETQIARKNLDYYQ